jgi:lipopolysaccharide transport system permease protein
MSNLPITVYSPESDIVKPKVLFRNMFRDLKAARGLAFQLTKRDISAQYRQSYLGYFWAFITPLMNSLTWIFMQFAGIVKLADTGIPYPVYVFSGTILWQIFTESISSPIQQINSSKSLLAKLNFPREALLMSGIYKVLFNSAVKLVILFPVLFLFGIVPDWKVIFFPFAVLSMIMVGLTIGLFLAPIGALYKDIGRLIPMATQLLMYLSPVVYAIPKEGMLAKLFHMNFITPLLMTARSLLTAGPLDWLPYFAWVNVGTIVLLLISWIVFRITMPVLIERMSA